MKELVGRDVGETFVIRGKILCLESNGCGVGVFHASAFSILRKVVDEQICVEWTVVHPLGFGGDNALGSPGELLYIVTCGVRVHDDAVVPAIMVEISLPKSAEFDG